MTIYEILDDIRRNSISQADKGLRFEVLIHNYFLTDKVYANDITDVWLWQDFPYRKQFGGSDIGIDLVVRSKADEYWAVQCKCYDKGTTLDKSAVDSFISTSAKSFEVNGQKYNFERRYWFQTQTKFNKKAEEAVKNQTPIIQFIGLNDLDAAEVDWEELYNGKSGSDAQLAAKVLRDDQKEAIDKAMLHFSQNDRGKMIMACGTGKTFTSLRLAEEMTMGEGLILFLVPSIALLSQTLRSWKTDARNPLSAICICSDSGVAKKKDKDESGTISIENLSEPATTDINKIRNQLLFHKQQKKGMLVVFSTYQSIEVISGAQQSLGSDFTFDLIVCDEAHRTTGISITAEDESNFVKVHNNDFIKARKRLYMTATPRVYSPEAQSKAEQKEVDLISMDNKDYYGEEFYRMSFGEAVKRGILTDYKVIVLTLDSSKILSNDTFTENVEDWAKIKGSISALSKLTVNNDTTLYADDPTLMHTAVAFCPNIKISKNYAATYNTAEEKYTYKVRADIQKENAEKDLVDVSAKHVDGSMTATERNEAIQWLKDTPVDGNECRILTNVRCLSEGVDVPSLDAAIFLSPRDSQVEIVQAVGRVMRKHDNKKFGYLIIPVLVNTGSKPQGDDAEDTANKILDKSAKDFQIVWKVISALRSHDERLEIKINNPDFSQGSSGGDRPTRPDNPIIVDGTPFDIPQDVFAEVFYARMVQKVGDRRYWVQWAKDIALIVEKHIQQIKKKINHDALAQQEFTNFLNGLHAILNDSITKESAISMLAQQMVTKPVFEALFDDARFVSHNPVSRAMDHVLDILDIHATSSDDEIVLESFYESVRERAKAVKTAEGRQKIIVELYDSFFKNAFPKMVEQLGIVYTPVEVVDFIIFSVADVLKKEFGRNISDEGVNILDPFTGTGTFIVRLLQSGLIKPEDLIRKFTQEINANEIVLLAYYIAAINIENAFHAQINKDENALFFQEERGKYFNFDGICLTDTFQLYENMVESSGVQGQQTHFKNVTPVFPVNSRQLQKQQSRPIQIVISNPPYSVGQKSANDNAQNLKYPALDKRIEETYVKGSKASLNKACYDSYIKAFRYATDRIDPEHGGIIGFVTNGSWLDTNGLDGFRKSIEQEFSAIYVFNLRGNCRTQGEQRRKEGGGVFGLGSRTLVSITILVKNPDYIGKAEIHYYDIGDYLSRAQKLKIVAKFGSIANLPMKELQPNEHGDWLDQRNESFGKFTPIQPEKKFDVKSQTWFVVESCGILTAKDSWLYNMSLKRLTENISKMTKFYNEQKEKYSKSDKNIPPADFVLYDPTQITWSDMFLNDLKRGISYDPSVCHYRDCQFRPYVKNNFCYEKQFIQRTYQLPSLYPNEIISNISICVPGIGVTKDFSTIITNIIPDYELIGKSHCFPLYYYEKVEEKKNEPRDLFASVEDEGPKYIRRDGVSDWILARVQKAYGKQRKVTKEDIFYYVYGFLHSQDYRRTFSADLKKMLPRIPMVDTAEEFWAFSQAGRDLADLHLNYETVVPYADLDIKISAENYEVVKMKFIDKADKTKIRYNDYITIENIPLKAYEYVVNGKSAIEWIMERYAVTTDKASGIKNDPNDWCREHDDEKYIFNLLRRIIYVSLETMRIVESLPRLDFSDGNEKKEEPVSVKASDGTQIVITGDNTQVYPSVTKITHNWNK